mgnify:CR=1 FL=1
MTASARSAAAPGRGKWVLVAVAVVVAGIAVYFGVRILLSEETQEPAVASPAPRPREAPPEPNSKRGLTTEEEVVDLKKQELQLIEQLKKDFPDSEQPLVLMGDVQRRRGNIEEARRLWQESIRMNPKRADVYDKLAQSAFEVDQFEEAISLWRSALETDAALPGTHDNIARALMRLGRYEESIAEIEKDLRLRPDVPLSRFLLGRAYQHLQDYEKARRNYEKVIELEPDHVNAYYGLYNVCARLRETEAAKRYLAEFKRLDTERQEAIHRYDRTENDLAIFSRGLARLCVEAHELYRTRGNGPKIEEMLKKAIALDPENASHMEKLVAFYTATNRLPEAIALCRRIEQVDPENLACQLNLGRLSMRAGRFEEAEKAFLRAITLAPNHSSGYQELARLYRQTKTKLPQARDLAQKVVELDPTAENYFVLGWACDVNGDPAGALAALQRAMQLDPENSRYGRAYRALEKREDSK